MRQKKDTLRDIVRRTQIIAHRGFHITEPENTIKAFKEAIKNRFKIIEFDVRKTKDGEYLIFHDKHLGDRPVSDYTFRELKKTLNKKNINPATLDETISLMKDKVLLDIELKEMGYETEVMEYILERLEPEEFFISSFNDSSLRKIKRAYPAVTTGLIFGIEKPKIKILTRSGELFPWFRVLRCRPDILIPYWKIFDVWMFRKAFLRKRQIYVWTVNDIGKIEYYLKHPRVHAITTDIPGEAEKLKQKLLEETA